jgi:hypothetical protein
MDPESLPQVVGQSMQEAPKCMEKIAKPIQSRVPIESVFFVVINISPEMYIKYEYIPAGYNVT